MIEVMRKTDIESDAWLEPDWTARSREILQSKQNMFAKCTYTQQWQFKFNLKNDLVNSKVTNGNTTFSHHLK